jgi:hypothetical protein
VQNEQIRAGESGKLIGAQGNQIIDGKNESWAGTEADRKKKPSSEENKSTKIGQR